jgi:hypothetical protein
MGNHAGKRNDVKDDSGYAPTHAAPKWDAKDWQNYDGATAETTVMPKVKDSKAKNG